jgi:hypothetical protein
MVVSAGAGAVAAGASAAGTGSSFLLHALRESAKTRAPRATFAFMRDITPEFELRGP